MRRGLKIFLLVWLLPGVVPALWGDSQVAVRGQDDLPVTYGTKSSGQGAVSLNGTSGLAKMLEERGCSVRTSRRLSPRINRFETMFWFPDSRSVITEEERFRLQEWLSQGWRRTLVVVGRDYDATLDYLQNVGRQAEKESAATYRRRLAQAVSDDLLQRLDASQRECDGWVAWEPQGHRPVEQLQGTLAEGLGPVRMTQGRYPSIPLANDRVSSNLHHEVLLTADDQPFMIQVTSDFWEEGRVIVVSNGSFLLNYGLTDSNNRELASRLLDEIAMDDAVLFLESDAAGLPVVERDESRQNTMWDWMQQWPFNFIIPHFLVVGVLMYFIYFPIFGRPKRLQTPSSTDFGQHVEALGELMEKTRDRDYAVRHLRYYHEHVRRDSSGLGVDPQRSTRVSAPSGSNQK